MPRPKADPNQRRAAYLLHKEGAGPKAIYESLYSIFDEEVVSERTVATWVKGFKGLSEEVVILDSPFEWHRMEQYGLPWEASAYIMDTLYANEMMRDSDRAAGEQHAKLHPGDEVIIRPRFTVGEALWCWRVHLAAPEIGSAVGVHEDVSYLATQFAARETFANVLGEPLYMADLEGLLAFKPWLDFQKTDVRHQAYHKAVNEGVIPPLTRTGLMTKALNVWPGRAVTLTQYAVGFAMAIHMTRGVHSSEHPELLMSQQLLVEGSRKEKE